MTCCFSSSFKTLLTLTEDNPRVTINVLGRSSLAGFQVTQDRPVLGESAKLGLHNGSSGASPQPENSAGWVLQDLTHLHQVLPLKESSFAS
jgi:hypothetical protein